MQHEIENQFITTLKDNPELEDTIKCVSIKLGIDTNQILKGLMKYDGGTEYSNNVYNELSVRTALYIKYFIKDSYHTQRQALLTKLLSHCQGLNKIVDIGYGAPGLYIRDYVLKNKNIHLTMLDKFESAESASKALLECAYNKSNWKDQINFLTFDLDREISPGNFEVYILFDSIEHAKNPSKLMEIIIENAPTNAQFLMSLPIGSLMSLPNLDSEPFHFIEWKIREDGINWLNKLGLVVIEEYKISPDKADKWAVGLDFYNLIIRAKK